MQPENKGLEYPLSQACLFTHLGHDCSGVRSFGNCPLGVRSWQEALIRNLMLVLVGTGHSMGAGSVQLQQHRACTVCAAILDCKFLRWSCALAGGGVSSTLS